MKKIEDPFIIEKYYNELNMQEIFINDVTKHMKLLKFDKKKILGLIIIIAGIYVMTLS